jgi:hypothetical protein
MKMQYRPEETRKYVTRRGLAAGHFGAFCVQVAVGQRQQLRFPEGQIMSKKDRDKVKTQELNHAIESTPGAVQRLNQEEDTEGEFLKP